jgi:Ca-activated chloride channel family protein
VRRVGYLLDEIRLHGETAERKNEVTQLARQYGIVTPYTAYLILEEEARRNVPLSQRTIKSGTPASPASSTGVPSASAGSRGAGGVGGGGGGQATAAVAVERAILQRSDIYRQGKTGLDSIADSQTSFELKNAVNAQGLQRAKDAQQNGLWGGAGDSAVNQAAYKIANQNAKVVKGRSFYKDGNQWVDSEAQSKSKAQSQTVKFGSDAYFALLRKHPDAAAWLAVGANLQLVLDDVVYEIAE